MKIDGLGSLNKSTGVNKLIAAFGNDIYDVDTGLGFAQNIVENNKAEFTTYLDYLFFVNGYNQTRAYTGTDWFSTGYRARCPIAKYLQTYKTKLYLANISVNNRDFASRVWHTDLPYNNDIRWGIEWGSNLAQTVSSAIVTSTGAFFQTYGIKAGDPLFVLDGANKGQYTILTVDSETQLTLTANLTSTQTSTNYIVGSNYFDVETNNGDVIKGITSNFEKLLIFKLFSLHVYNGASLFPVPGAIGTSSHRSIVNIRGYTLYFHGSESSKTGIYLFDGSSVIKVSNAVQPYIDGISSTNFPETVAWNEGNWYRVYVGDIDNTQRNISLDDVIISFDVINNKFSIDPVNKNIACSTTFLESNQQKIFFGDDNGEVFQTPSGYNFDGSPISFIIETGVHYPVGVEQYLRFTRIQIIARDAAGVSVKYKLYNTPLTNDDQWNPLGQIVDDKTEFQVPKRHNFGAGIEIRCDETSTAENTPYIEKILIFYTLESTRVK